MPDGATIGSVAVEINPDAANFWAKFEAQTRSQAGAAGDSLGTQIGKQIADQIAKGIRDGLGKGTQGSPAKEPGRKSGDDFAGEFERIVKTRISAALKSLPKAEIGASATEAEQKIKDIRAELQGLRDAKVGVDLTDAEAIAKLRELNERLNEISTKSPNIQVSVDAARAAAEIAAVGEEARRLAGDNPTVKVDADTGSAEAKLAAVDTSARSAGGGVSALVAAGIGIGPAIVPGAAAAVAALAAIGPAALGAAGGIGVVALAASGVIGAVKAMSAADDQSAQSAVSLAGKQSQVAAAADQVKSAQASLANTVANAGTAQARAAEQVRNAEQSLADARINAGRANEQAAQAEADAEVTLTRAERDAVKAQQDLTQAKQDAKRASEDLTNQIIDNGLAQQRAVIAVQDAQRVLDNTLSNPQATQRQRQEAQIAFEEAKQHLLEIGITQQRLTDDKAKSDKAGVDGSKQVVAAQDRVLSTQDAVAKAEQGVAKAREDAANTARTSAESVAKAQQAVADAQRSQADQQRQSAFAVAQAQQGVINAQRSLQQATVSTGTAGGAAMLKLQQAMDNLSPAGQKFAAFIYGLKTPLLDLRRTAETGLLPGLQAGIEALLPVLPNVSAGVGAFASEMGHLFQAGGQALAAPFWQDFFRFTVSTAIPALDNAAHVAGNFAVGLAGLYRAFVPLGQDVGVGLLNFSRDFALHAVTLQNTAGYRQFLDYVRTEGPIVAHTIGEVVQAAVRLVEAISPFGGVSLTAIRLLAEAINGLPVPALTALTGAIGSVVLAIRGWNQINGLLNGKLGEVLAAVQLFGGEIAGGFRAGIANAGTETGKFGTALAGLKGAGKGAAEGVGGLTSLIGIGGPLAVGLAVGAVLVGTWANAHAAAAAKVAAHKRSVDDINAAIKQNSGAIDENVRKVAAKNALDQGALGLAEKTGVSVSDVTNAYIHGGTAVDGITAQLDKYITAQQESQQKDQEHSSTYTKNIKNARDLIDTLNAQKKAVSDNTSETSRASAQQKLLDQAMRDVTGAAASQTPEQQALGTALRTVSDESKTATDRADALKAADEAVFGAARNAITAAQDQALALLQVTAAGKQNAEQNLFGKGTLDLHSEASIRNRQMLEQRFSALGQEYLADVQSGVAVDAATTKHDTNRDAIEKAAIAAGFDKDQVHKLADTFGTLPTDPKVQVTVSGVQDALTQMQNLEIAQLALKQGLDPAAATKEWKAQHRQAVGLGQGLATGGPVFGAGTATSDSIPAWLSNGEHVWTAAEVNAAGGHAVVEELRKRVLGPRGPQVLYPGDLSGGIAFAGGGAVTWPFPASAWMTKIPSLDEIRRAVTFGPDYTGPISGGLEAAAAFVRAQVGKPYVWASAGPGGYDCSGLLSAAYLVAHGRSPYSHIFSTATEAPYFPLPGYGAFTAGWTNPGEPGPGGSDVGHTAGKIGNMAFESVGGAGVRIGPSVTPIGRFAHIGHYDSGGYLPPGLTLAYNGTGQPETIRTADQEAALGHGGTTITIPVTAGPGMNVTELAHAVAAELAWQMR